MSLKEEFVKEWPKALIGLVFVIAISKGEKIYDYFNAGVDVEFNKKMDARIKEKMNDSHLIETLLNSKQVEDFKKEAGQELKNSILSEDTSKLSIPSYLGKELGLRDEDVLPFLAQFMKQVKEGKIATKEDLEKLSSRRNPNSNEF